MSPRKGRRNPASRLPLNSGSNINSSLGLQAAGLPYRIETCQPHNRVSQLLKINLSLYRSIYILLAMFLWRTPYPRKPCSTPLIDHVLPPNELWASFWFSELYGFWIGLWVCNIISDSDKCCNKNQGKYGRSNTGFRQSGQEGASAEVTFEQRPGEVRKWPLVLWGKSIPAERRAGAKALGWEWAWSVWETARRPVHLQRACKEETSGWQAAEQIGPACSLCKDLGFVVSDKGG